MRSFHCDCGNRVFFDNQACLACGRALGFDFATLRLVPLAVEGEFRLAADGARFRPCANQLEHGNCNWLVAVGDAGDLCPACRLNEVIPALSREGNLKLWTRVEQAKRRLLYSLGKLGLPLARPDGSHPLRFRILEDRRRNPALLESFVATAPEDGAITSNIAEADDAVRHAVREQMHERYRTVLGHLRHEAGHYYFSALVDSAARQGQCRALFGDERSDYDAALARHYRDGPPADWPERFVSAYASSHPAEDFAETFAQFLHIDDARETAHAAGLSAVRSCDPEGRGDWIGNWIELAVTLNEILRSLGADDPYPFVLTQPVRDKLNFIDRLVCRRAAPPAA